MYDPRLIIEPVTGLALALMAFLFWRQRVAHDREHRRQLETNLLEHAKELAAERESVGEALRVKGHFEANLSHEIRTPLNGLLGTLNLALMTELNREQRYYLELSKSSAEALQALLDDLLDFSHIAVDDLKLNRDEFQLEPMVRGAVTTVKQSADQKGLTVRTEIGKDIPDRLVGDATRLHQVLIKILDNAVKFSSNGDIEVNVRREGQFSGAGPSDPGSLSLRFSVRDHGIGIPEDKRELIFKPFRQADGSSTRKYEGAGLGLAICRRLVRLMNGRIWVESEVGQGSTFHFTTSLRIGPHATEDVAVPVGDAPRTRHSGRRQVLLAEDNRVNQVVTMRLLEKRGFHCLVASNGREALEMLEGAAVDLILMDVQMPDMDGLETTRCIRDLERKTGAHLPILALTAHAMDGDREKCLAAGMDGYVSKPVQPAQLYESIEALIGSVS